MSAPIFYRDVPLMPASGNGGSVAPLAESNIRLIHWRIRDIRKPESRTVLSDMPTCANCHSFSADGKTFGMDIDGPANDKGLYAVVPVQKNMAINSKDMVHWNTDGKVGTVRVGFMSQVSPTGQYVLSTFAGPALSRMIDSYYVTNFMDYRFLQVFFRRAASSSTSTAPQAFASPCRALTIRSTCRPMACGVPTESTLCLLGPRRATRVPEVSPARPMPTIRMKRRSSTTFIEFLLTVGRVERRSRSRAPRKMG